MLTTTSGYALRSMVVLAELGESEAVSSQRIARGSGVPRKYLSKILADMVCAGLLTAGRGRGGGFRLAKRSERIRLFEVVAPFEPVSDQPMCPLGKLAWTDAAPCGAHQRWKAVQLAYDRFLRETTIADVAAHGSIRCRESSIRKKER